MTRTAFRCFSLLAALFALTASGKAATPVTTLHTFGAYQDGHNPTRFAKLLLASDDNFYGTTLADGTNNGGTVYRITPAGVMTTLHSFTNVGTPRDGYGADGALTEGADGFLYGTCEAGGDTGGGTIYRLKKDGTAFHVVFTFPGGVNGYLPRTGVTYGADGFLYGTTEGGSSTGDGVVYKVKTDGSGYKALYSINTGPEGYTSVCALTLVGTTLYGVLNNGGPGQGYGSVYRLSTDGTGFSVLHGFRSSNSSTDGTFPSGLMVGKDGRLYGLTARGGANNAGTVFQLTTGGSFKVLHSLSASSVGANFNAVLAQDSSGTLYGTTDTGGTAGRGSVFKVSTSGSGFTVLHSFAGDSSEGVLYSPGVTVGPDGRLYGTRYQGGAGNVGTFYSLSTSGSGFKVAYDFSNGFVDGRNPYYGSLVLGAGNNYYGTTYRGGAAGGYGTVYKMAPGGTVTILHAFSNNASTEDGANPYGGLLGGSGSTLLGTTFYGGSYGAGIAFSVDGSGNFATLADFGQAAGANLPSDLVRAPSGILYGTSYYGGKYNKGCVFRIGTDGFESVIYSFKNAADGQFPNGKLLVGKDGNLYGTTYSGGASGSGTVYKVTPAGTFTLLHTYKADGSEGANPYSGLTQDGAGKLYGTTYQRGQFGYGTLFTLGTDGSAYKTLHAFATATDGAYPYAGVLLASDGRLYGTTSGKGSVNGGSNNGYGTVYRVSTSGSSFSVLHTFLYDGTEGGNPYSGLLEGPDGNLLGTTYNGGALPYPGTKVYGSVYKVSTLLPLVASFSPTSAAKGATVTLSGVNFTGATAVTFGTGLTNALTVNSDTKITVTVPSNAKTGAIVVTTPKGSGTSTGTFTVQ